MSSSFAGRANATPLAVLKTATATGQVSTAVPSIFTAATDFHAQAHDESEAEDDGELHIAPIPLPELSASDANAPLLDAMKRTRDDPERFEAYVKSRPKELDPTDEAFNKVPVEEFGKAMLAGMGYKGGDDTVQPYLLDGRPNLLGLGAKPKPQDEARNNKFKRVYVLIGSVGQIEGTHRFAVVSQTDGVPGLDMIRVRTPGIASLGESEDELMEIDIPRKKLALISDIHALGEAHPARRVIAMNNRRVDEDAVKAEAAFNKRQKHLTDKVNSNKDIWVRPGIRVLIVDEKDSINYRKKGIVVSVDSDGRCSIRLEKDLSIILKRLKPRYLQTVVPDKPGSQMIVVSGRRRVGERGEMVERDKRSSKATLKFSNGSVEIFNFDDVCELTDSE